MLYFFKSIFYYKVKKKNYILIITIYISNNNWHYIGKSSGKGSIIVINWLVIY
jgi:hypothetical protein